MRRIPTSTEQPDADFEAEYERVIKALGPVARSASTAKSPDSGGMDELAEELNRYIEQVEINHEASKKVRR